MKNKIVSQDFYKEIQQAIFLTGKSKPFNLITIHLHSIADPIITEVHQTGRGFGELLDRIRNIYFVDCPNTMMLWKKHEK
jgi:hypothetical protein